MRDGGTPASERGDMSEDGIGKQKPELISIRAEDAAEVSALVLEMAAMVGRLGREARQMREELEGIRKSRRTAADSEPSAHRLPPAAPEDLR